MSAPNYVRWFREIRLEDVPLVGGKNAALGELYSTLASEGVRVPNGFALTAQAYRNALADADATNKLHRLLDGLDKTDIETLAKRAGEARHIVYAATGGDDLRQQVRGPGLALKHIPQDDRPNHCPAFGTRQLQGRAAPRL
jgi:pyruvate, water dikinase